MAAKTNLILTSVFIAMLAGGYTLTSVQIEKAYYCDTKDIVGFFDGKLPDGSPFYLKGVGSQWDGRDYKTLNESDKNRFRQSILRVIIVEQIDPKDTSSMYEVFSRLNTGGTALSPQEVRNASCHGPFNDMLKDINKNEKLIIKSKTF
jgi:hypothetical protein